MKLIAGPDYIEFGWLVATWIPAVRAKAKEMADEPLILCEPGNEYLYQDFTDSFARYKGSSRRDRWLCAGKRLHIPGEIKRSYPGGFFMSPSKRTCKTKGEHRKYGTPGKVDGYDIVFHARAITRYHQSKLNWARKKYNAVAAHFAGLRMCSIGTEAYCVKGTDDLRNIPVEHLCDILANSRVIAGTSSGPLHLASLCGCPQVVLTGSERHKSLHGHTNRWRYENGWNPFKTPCTVLDKHRWHPPVKFVTKAIGEYVK